MLAVLVTFSLYRNHKRHEELLNRRGEILKSLNLPGVRLDFWFYAGRWTYFFLFALGLGYELFLILALMERAADISPFR